jgi:hypothetical protein
MFGDLINAAGSPGISRSNPASRVRKLKSRRIAASPKPTAQTVKPPKRIGPERPPKASLSRTLLTARLSLAERASEASAAAWRLVPPHALRHVSRCAAPIASARQAAIYFEHVVFAANLTRAGRIFGRDRTTARHACSRMEDWRDDPRIDRAFDALEPALRSWVRAFSADDLV